MRVLWRRPSHSTLLRKWLQLLVTHLQFGTIFPLALCVIICYPFFLSLREDPRPCILLHQAIPRPGTAIAHMRQAIFVPPVFVSALDPKITEIIAPLRGLHEKLKSSNTTGRLFSLFDSETPAISQFVAPTASNVQGLLFTYVYEHQQDATLWEDALNLISTGNHPKQPPSNFVDRGELEEAELTTASSANYSVWPGASNLLQLVIAICVLMLLAYSILWIHSTSTYRPWFMVLCISARVGLGVCSAVSVVSFLYPAFNTHVLSRFLWVIIVAAYVGVSNSTQIIELAESALADSQTALNRLTITYQQSLKSIIEVIGVQLLLGVLSVVCTYFTQQPTLRPLTAFMIAYMAIDICLHYTFFAAVMYIDMISLDMYDLTFVERPYARRKTLIRKICESNASCLLQAIAYNFDLVIYLPVITYLVLHCNGGYFLNKIHPHIKHALRHPEYIDSFVNPLDPALRQYSFLEIFRPIVFDIGGHFGTPTGRINFTASTLRYGNTFSMLLEMFCLTIFFSSLGMIALLLLTDKKALSFMVKGLDTEQELFNEVTLDVNSPIDLVKIATDDLWISVLGFDGGLTVIDFTSMRADHSRIINLPTVRAPWVVEEVLLNATDGVVGTLYRSELNLWNIATGQKYYQLDYSQTFNSRPLATTFVKTTLLLVCNNGRLVEVYTTRPPQVHSLSQKSLRWAIFHQLGNDTKAVLCDVDNNLLMCTRTGGDQPRCKSVPLQLSTAYLVHHSINDVEPNRIPSFKGMLPVPAAWTEEYTGTDSIVAAMSVSDIQLWVAFTETKVMFIDLISGVIHKISDFTSCKPETVRVSHSQPTHCAFCGSTAITSLTIAYESLLYEGEVICETWKIPNKSRNAICLRIERDPHETRCRGFASTETTKVHINGVKSWAPTKINMIMGLRSSGESTPSHSLEAFAVSTTTGVTSQFPLDESSVETQLMTTTPGKAMPLGAKSVCIPFGNTVKILYLQ